MSDFHIPDDLTLRIADPRNSKVRETWKFVKKKHDVAITAKKIKFAKELGPMLDARAALWAKVDQLSKKRDDINRKFKMKVSELKGTDKEWSQEKRTKKAAEANTQGDAVVVEIRAVLTSIEKQANSIKDAAKAYKVKIKGLGDPAEEELEKVLDDIIARADGDIRTAQVRNN